MLDTKNIKILLRNNLAGFIFENSSQFTFFRMNVLGVQVAFFYLKLNYEPEQEGWSYLVVLELVLRVQVHLDLNYFSTSTPISIYLASCRICVPQTVNKWYENRIA